MTNYTPPTSDIIEIKEKLEIAVKCLKEYTNPENWYTTEEGEKCFFCVNGYSEAEEALKKIKGGKNDE